MSVRYIVLVSKPYQCFTTLSTYITYSASTRMYEYEYTEIYIYIYIYIS